MLFTQTESPKFTNLGPFHPQVLMETVLKIFQKSLKRRSSTWKTREEAPLLLLFWSSFLNSLNIRSSLMTSGRLKRTFGLNVTVKGRVSAAIVKILNGSDPLADSPSRNWSTCSALNVEESPLTLSSWEWSVAFSQLEMMFNKKVKRTLLTIENFLLFKDRSLNLV